MKPVLHRWNQIRSEVLKPGASRRVLHTAGMTIARLELARGAVVPRHSHPNEQVTNVERGRLLFVFDDESMTVAEGQSLTIPPHVPHAVEALEDAVALDLFTPPREDWIRGDDAYLR